MEPTDLTGLTKQQQIYFIGSYLILSAVGKLLGALTNGGGLKNILLNAWQGKAVPKPIAQDYKQELAPRKEDPLI